MSFGGLLKIIWSNILLIVLCSIKPFKPSEPQSTLTWWTTPTLVATSATKIIFLADSLKTDQLKFSLWCLQNLVQSLAAAFATASSDMNYFALIIINQLTIYVWCCPLLWELCFQQVDVLYYFWGQYQKIFVTLSTSWNCMWHFQVLFCLTWLY